MNPSIRDSAPEIDNALYVVDLPDIEDAHDVKDTLKVKIAKDNNNTNLSVQVVLIRDRRLRLDGCSRIDLIRMV